MSAALYLSAESLAQGVAAWFAVQVDLQADEDLVTRRMRAAIEAAVGDRLVDHEAVRTIALAELHAVADGIEGAHPFGVEVTLRHLQKARELIAKTIEGTAP